MHDYESVPERMNVILYLSYTGFSKAAAEYLSKKTGYPLYSIHDVKEKVFDRVYFFFPVHAERAPKAAYDFLKTIKYKSLVLIATFGRKHHGDALDDLISTCNLKMNAGMYFPTKHSYIVDDDFNPPYEALDELIGIDDDKFITVPKVKTTFGATFKPTFRAKLAIKILCSSSCIKCNTCHNVCPTKAIKYGKIDNRCIRCGSCVYNCPVKALSFKLSFPLKKYLQDRKEDKPITYK